MRSTGLCRWLPTVLATCVFASACGADDGVGAGGGTTSESTLQVAGSATPAGTTAPPPPTPSTSLTDTAVDTTTPPSRERRPIRSEEPLVAGSYRSTAFVGPGLALDIDLPQDDLVALDSEGAFFIATDATGAEVLVMVWQVDNAAALEPTADLIRLADQEYARQVSSAVPSDTLAWLASRPGVIAGDLTSTELGGVPARSQSFTFGPFDGALPCSPADTAPCHVLIWAPSTGVAYSLEVSDGLLVTELTVGGHRLAVMHDVTMNPELAAEIAASLKFTVFPHPAAPTDAMPLPFAGLIEPGATYVHERSSGGVWLVPGAEGVATVAGFLRDRFVRFSADGTECGSLTDSTQGVWFGVAEATDGVGPTSAEIPADLAAVITAAADLRVVAGPAPVDLGDVEGVSFDVTPVGDVDVLLAGSSHAAIAGATTRVIVAPRTDGGADMAVVTRGTACEALLAGLAFLPGAER